MSRKLKIIGLVIVADLLVIAGIVFYMFGRDAVAPQSAGGSESPGYAIYPTPIVLTDFQLIDQDGREFTVEQFKGKWTLVFFGFSSCQDVCPLTLFELKKFYASLSSSPLLTDTRIAMVSVDPARDTPEVLKQYMASFHPEFLGLTGSLTTISDLAQQMYISRMDPPGLGEHAGHGATDYQVEHSAHIAILDPQARYHAVIMSPHSEQKLLAAYTAIRGQ